MKPNFKGKSQVLRLKFDFLPSKKGQRFTVRSNSLPWKIGLTKIIGQSFAVKSTLFTLKISPDFNGKKSTLYLS